MMSDETVTDGRNEGERWAIRTNEDGTCSLVLKGPVSQFVTGGLIRPDVAADWAPELPSAEQFVEAGYYAAERDAGTDAVVSETVAATWRWPCEANCAPAHMSTGALNADGSMPHCEGWVDKPAQTLGDIAMAAVRSLV